MSASYSRFELIGRLGKPPELKYLPNGGTICNLTIAVNSGEETDWHYVSLFDKNAELINSFNLPKGTIVFVAGKIRQKVKELPDGKRSYHTNLNAYEFQVLDSKARSEELRAGADPGGFQRETQRATAVKNSRKRQAAMDMPADDIPF